MHACVCTHVPNLEKHIQTCPDKAACHTPEPNPPHTPLLYVYTHVILFMRINNNYIQVIQVIITIIMVIILLVLLYTDNDIISVLCVLKGCVKTCTTSCACMDTCLLTWSLTCLYVLQYSLNRLFVYMSIGLYVYVLQICIHVYMSCSYV